MLPENKCQSINLKEKSEMVVKDKKKKKSLAISRLATAT